MLVYDSIGVTSSHEVSFVVEQHLGEVCLLGVCPEVSNGFTYSCAFASARRVVGVLSDVQVSVGGFDVCFDVQFAHVRLVWINLFVGNDVEKDYLILAFLVRELGGFVGSVHVSDELYKSIFRVWPN